LDRRRLGFWIAYDRDYDLIRATREVVKKYPEIHDPKEIERLIRSEGGYAHGMRDPDILVRTGAKKWPRTSGAFMGRETEIHFTETLWPDFSLDTLKKIIEWAQDKVHTHGR
jgi:undecaprenyl diphosphate synthase